MGTTLLVELARAISEMVRHGSVKVAHNSSSTLAIMIVSSSLTKMYSPSLTDHLSLRRSLVFASWSAGEYGSIGATEWQEVSIAVCFELIYF